MDENVRLELLAKAEGNLPMTLTAEEVRQVVGLFPKAEPPAEVAPVEDEPAKPKQGNLPDDFPGRAALADAGINTFAQVRKQRDGEGLTAVAGIGEATARKIDEAL